MNGTRRFVFSLLGLAISSVATGTAAADFGPIQLASKSALEQADEAVAPAISADGRYLAFQATIEGRDGIFRKDLVSGALVPVVAANAYAEEEPGADAALPSISADGRYVSFTTRAPLIPADDAQPESSDVYVADMGTSLPTYELASALDGSSHGLTYAAAGGSVASGRVALSADGRRVVFITTADSDLTSGPGESTPGTPTPAGQVVLRNLDSQQTTLVSAERDPGSGEMTDLPVSGGAVIEKPNLPRMLGAALSADGTTVAWLGAHLPAQAPLLADEAETISAQDGNGTFPYDEPLWRRIASGSAAPTRRIVGGGDPLALGCPPDGTLTDPSCRGPFPGLTGKNTDLNAAEGWLGVGRVDGVPQLSADGRTVALIGNPTEATNVFVVDMGEGLNRIQAVHQLTREVPVDPNNPAGTINQEPYVPLNGHIFDLALSADGLRIAFATARQQFPLAPPNLLGSPPASLGLTELYLIDDGGETLQRVTHGYNGEAEASLASTGSGQEGAGASSPSFAASGGLIAFASNASNLVGGDANGAGDAFVVEAAEVGDASGESSISPQPFQAGPKRLWRLIVSTVSLPSGCVKLVAVAPGAGTLRARAGAAVGSGLTQRTLDAARASTSGGRLALVLELPRRYRWLAREGEGLYATVRISFRSAGRKPLRSELEVRFRTHRGKRARQGI